MILVQPGENFGFNYEAYDQSDDLDVAFNVWDVSSGVPVFLEQIESVYAGFGSYVGTYPAEAGIKYVVDGFVFTDDTFTTIDTSRAPFSACYAGFAGESLSMGFVYASYDFLSTLNIRAMIYDSTSGTPVLEDTVDLIHIENGIYFGSFDGEISSNYQIISVVYTDDTFTTPNYNYAPASTTFSVIGVTPAPASITGALIDVTDLFHDTDFVEGISLITRVPSVNSYGESILSESTVNSIGSVQPASGKDLLRLPEELRLKDVFTFWYQGDIIATAPGLYSSILVFKGKRYQVQRVLDWSSWGRGWTEGLCIAELPS